MSLPSYSKYKDSGVEWLGNVPEGWGVTKVGFCCDFFTGWTPPTGDESSYDGDLLWANISDIGKKFLTETAKRISISAVRHYKIRIAPAGSLLFSFKLSIGQVSIADVPMYTNEAIAIFQSGTKILSHWAYYTFPVFIPKNASENIYGAKMLNQYLIKSAKILLPSVEEQQNIAAFLDAETARIDALVAEYETLIDLLKEKRQALISQVVTKGLNPDVPMKDSGVEWLGEVPEHWRLYQTKRLFRLVVEQAPDDNNEELLSIYTSIGVRPRKSLEEKGNKATTTNGYWIVRKGDIIVNKLLAWMGAIGLSEYDGVTSPAYDIFRRIKPLVPKYYSELFRCGIMFSEFRRHSRGIMDMRLRLYFEDFGQLVIPYPPPSEQMEIVKALELELGKMDELVANAEIGINLLKERRTTLISDAVTGKIDVRTSSVVDTSDIA